MIITSIVDMAKKIGIGTLAEGVENAEQLKFLSDIGCEKVQGFFYGKPLTFENALKNCHAKLLSIEARAESKFYRDAGRINLITDRPLGILLMDKGYMEWKYLNDGNLEVIKSLGTRGITESSLNLNKEDSPLYYMYRNMAKKVIESQKEEVFTYIDKDVYVKVTAHLVSTFKEKYLFCVSLDTLELDSDTARQNHIDKYVRDAIKINDVIQVINIKEDWCDIIMTSKIFSDNSCVRYYGIQKNLDFSASTLLYEEDRDRYLSFFDIETLCDRIRTSGKGYISNSFRIMNRQNGNYEKKTINIISIPRTNNNTFLILIKDLEESPFLNGNAENENNLSGSDIPFGLSYKDIWESLKNHPNIMWFFKDRNRKFTKASTNFLKYYNIDSEDILIGKTDEDMGWHTDNIPYLQDEKDVLNSGRCVINSPGSCIINGVNHFIYATKFPVYHNGKITGLFGYFFDGDDENYSPLKLESCKLIDKVTGLSNDIGFFTNLVTFEESRQKNKDEYYVALLVIDEYNRILNTYGKEVSEKLLMKIADILRKHIGINGVISRFISGRFIIIQKFANSENLQNTLHKISEDIHTIHDIDGFPCTVFAKYGIAMGSETDSITNLSQILNDRLADSDPESINTSIKNAIPYNERLFFDKEKFDNMNDIVYIADPDDHTLVYTNKLCRKTFGIGEDESLCGRKCYHVFRKQDSPCDYCTNNILKQDKFYEWKLHNEFLGKTFLIRDTLIPWNGKNYRFEIATDTTKFIETEKMNQKLKYFEQFENDVIHIVMRESNPNAGLRKMIDKIGFGFECDCAHLFELDENSKQYSNSYLWAKDNYTPLVTYINDDLINDTTNFMVQKLILNHRIIGYVVIEHPNPDTQDITRKILDSLSQFIVIIIQNRNTMEKLEIQSTTDGLTGALNRRAFNSYKNYLENQTDIVLIFCDINGLKETNDNLGHLAGDKLIKDTSDVLTQFFGKKNVFRMGGDEFLAFYRLSSKPDPDETISILKDSYKEKNIEVAIGYALHENRGENIEESLKIADFKMYQDKDKMKKEKSCK